MLKDAIFGGATGGGGQTERATAFLGPSPVHNEPENAP